MAARITFLVPDREPITLEGSEREIEQMATEIARGFEHSGGVWISNTERSSRPGWTAWIPASTPINVSLCDLEGVDAIDVTSVIR